MWKLFLPIICVQIVQLPFCEAALAESVIYFSQNPDGGWAVGWSANNPSGDDAFVKAEQNCRNHGGSNCQPTSSEVFHNTCAAIAVQQTGNGWAVRYGSDIGTARKLALSGCNRMGVRCSVKGSFCDSVVEQVNQMICTKPVFTEEMRLRATIDGTDAKTREVAEATNYLHQKYCRVFTGDRLVPEHSENVGDNCWQYSGSFRGELVYWGQCSE